MKPRSPLDAAIDKACGFDPEKFARQREREKRELAVMETLMKRLEEWYFVRNASTTKNLRMAWEDVLREDQKIGGGT